ncbi:uncharacterized protein LOC142348436 [Convolutriloba macropyga]|uniref:uncharacterized protein LOC142348436 n=1 Tax=Convolutriloba macropyga TaxID=536237 RepID=UPI003F525E55
MGIMKSSGFYVYPQTLQKAYFHETRFIGTNNPFRLDICPDGLICVQPISGHSNLCYFDDGSPLYTALTCQGEVSREHCLYGVSSYFKKEGVNPNETCNGGSFFTRALLFYDWIYNTIELN